MKSANAIDPNRTFQIAIKSEPKNWSPASSDSFIIETNRIIPLTNSPIVMQ